MADSFQYCFLFLAAWSIVSTICVSVSAFIHWLLRNTNGNIKAAIWTIALLTLWAFPLSPLLIDPLLHISPIHKTVKTIAHWTVPQMNQERTSLPTEPEVSANVNKNAAPIETNKTTDSLNPTPAVEPTFPQTQTANPTLTDSETKDSEKQLHVSEQPLLTIITRIEWRTLIECILVCIWGIGVLYYLIRCIVSWRWLSILLKQAHPVKNQRILDGARTAPADVISSFECMYQTRPFIHRSRLSVVFGVQQSTCQRSC